MATLYQRNGMWYGRFQYKGQNYRKSTGIEAPAKGKLAIAESKAQAEAEFNRMMVETKGGESVEALFLRLNEALANLPHNEQEPRRITLADRIRQGVSARLDLADAWQAWGDSPKRGRPSPSTITGYRAYWGWDTVKKRGRQSPHGFKSWLSTKHPHIKALHEITDAVAEEYAGHLMKSAVAPRTYNGTIKFLRSMFKTLKTRAGLSTNIWDEIPIIANETQGRRNLTDEELDKVCASATGDVRYLLAIGLYTGLRLGDAVSLQWDGGIAVDKFGKSHRLGVCLKEGAIRLIPQKTRRKQKVLTIPMHPVLGAMLTQLRADTTGKSYLFPDLADLHAKGRADAITKQIQGHFKACGIKTTEKMADGSRSRAIVRVGFHSLRHSFVSLCAANRVPQAAIQELVGHGSPAMTMLYSHADDSQKMAAILALPSITFDESSVKNAESAEAIPRE